MEINSQKFKSKSVVHDWAIFIRHGKTCLSIFNYRTLMRVWTHNKDITLYHHCAEEEYCAQEED